MAVRAGVLPGSPLWDDMQRKPVGTISEFTTRAKRFVIIEEARLALKLAPPPSITIATNVNLATTSATPSTTQPIRDTSFNRKKNEGNNLKADGGKKKKGDKHFSIYIVYTELTDTRENIFVMNGNQVSFRQPDVMRHQRTKRDSNKFCRFHKDVGHTTEECKQLKEEIEDLILRGYLGQYIQNQNQVQASPSQKIILTQPAQQAAAPPAREGIRPVPIDGEDVIAIAGEPHITRSGINTQKRFSGEGITSTGSIELPITLGDYPVSTTKMLEFIMVDTPFAYNVLLSRPALIGLGANTFVRHLAIKFPTLRGIGTLKGDQLATRECCNISMRGKGQASVQALVIIEEMDGVVYEVREKINPRVE
ncbi:uncharacterized protein LOC133825633 [Humulus lupulus]|uniref:uncharacterized protein LOC133825633 n=1 Tax=Humulus lupulus TaxID=3486 RepID=UPI002B412642|nr:uncharacterized protein LOC133825633 [Humulus lupulus]